MGQKHRHSEKNAGILSFILYPIAFFLVSASVLYAVGEPIVSPLLQSASVLTMESAPTFEALSSDIYESKDVESLPATNERIAAPSVDIPAYGDRYGQISCEKAGLDAPLYYGDGANELKLGVGTYQGAYIPGAGRTILLAGHRDTWFQRIDELDAGDIIHVNTSYGKYQYEVVDSRVATDTDTTAYDFSRKDENLIMYTCYPLDSVGLTDKRYFVYAKYVSGPRIGPMQSEIEIALR
jgi:sortase A